jgi:hypothetical protein
MLPAVSKTKFLKSYSLNNCLSKYSGLTISDCLESKSPSVGQIKREKGKEFSEGFVMLWLAELNEILDLKKPMSEIQIKLTAETILMEFYSFKVADLTLLFRNIITGVYGEFYERLSITKVISIFRQYNEDRMNLASENSRRNHLEEKSKSNQGRLNITNNFYRKT